MSTTALQARIAALQASAQPTPPPADPVVLTSQLAAKLATVASSLPATQPSASGVLWRNNGALSVTP
jgi:hypothetical protein